MSKIENFQIWAKQFITIRDSHVKEFLDSVEDLGLHEIKVLFSGKYQDRMELSYVIGTKYNLKHLCAYELINGTDGDGGISNSYYGYPEFEEDDKIEFGSGFGDDCVLTSYNVSYSYCDFHNGSGYGYGNYCFKASTSGSGFNGNGDGTGSGHPCLYALSCGYGCEYGFSCGSQFMERLIFE